MYFIIYPRFRGFSSRKSTPRKFFFALFGGSRGQGARTGGRRQITVCPAYRAGYADAHAGDRERPPSRTSRTSVEARGLCTLSTPDSQDAQNPPNSHHSVSRRPPAEAPACPQREEASSPCPAPNRGMKKAESASNSALNIPFGEEATYSSKSLSQPSAMSPP